MTILLEMVLVLFEVHAHQISFPIPDGSNNDLGRIRCYFVTDEGKSRPATRNGEAWYDDSLKPFRLGPRPRLAISEDSKNELQTLLEHTEKASQPAITPAKHTNQQLRADVNHVIRESFCHGSTFRSHAILAVARYASI
jgi:hypothetical protein